MNKKDLCAIIFCNATSILLFAEHLRGMYLALGCFVVWTIISVSIQLSIARNYLRPAAETVFVVWLDRFPFTFETYQEAECFCVRNRINCEKIFECAENAFT